MDNIDRLTVAAISQARVSRPLVAFLRASSTRKIGTVTSLDEGLDMTTAFKLAGFAHVIGTQWKAFRHFGDSLVPGFCLTLEKSREGYGGRLTNDMIEHSYHAAFLVTIGEYSTVPLHWAMFFHQGPWVKGEEMACFSFGICYTGSIRLSTLLFRIQMHVLSLTYGVQFSM
jgi:hypothetical protein